MLGPLSCAAGRYSSRTDLKTADSPNDGCSECTKGSACGVGSRTPSGSLMTSYMARELYSRSATASGASALLLRLESVSGLENSAQSLHIGASGYRLMEFIRFDTQFASPREAQQGHA